MKYMEYKSIPGYENYGVTKLGHVKNLLTGKNVARHLIRTQWGDYWRISTSSGKTNGLSVHRAVALAWIENDDPEVKTVVNHLDGIKTNNSWDNLEWTTCSGNNYHAINTGLRPDNIRCRIRDFETGEVTSFSSIAQAAEFMGMRKDTSSHMLLKKKFGALILDRYEFRFEDDPTPWFYVSRHQKVAARYMVIVTEPSGETKEIYSTRNMLREFQLYDSPYGKSIPALVRYAQEKYPDKTFTVRDSYTENRYRVFRNTELSTEWTGVKAEKNSNIIEFPSLTRTAKYFHVDRKSIIHRLDADIDLNGWLFTSTAA